MVRFLKEVAQEVVISLSFGIKMKYAFVIVFVQIVV